MHTQPLYDRYGRQMLLKELGEGGQQKLLQASVMVVGAGGLGCPALQYLVAAGVGKIGLVDDDVVALHNLHRQVLYATNDVGLPKADIAAKRLTRLNPEIKLEAHNVRLTTQNALDLLAGYDLVLDATDNFASRYLINDACVLLNKPLIYGAVSRFEGQVAVFNSSGDELAVNYRDLFPQQPPPGSVLNCAEAGVLGVLPGIIGAMQAAEAIKLVTGIGKPLINQLFTYNSLTSQSFTFSLSKNKAAAALLPKTGEEFRSRDYDWLCNTPTAVQEIEASAFSALLGKKGVCIIDVREEGEKPDVFEFVHRKIPLSVFKATTVDSEASAIVLFCQSGKRSKEAGRLLGDTFGESKKLYSLKGGILQWKQEHGKEAE